MNERIKLLAKEAGASYGDAYDLYLLEEQILKFAELIVAECIDVVDVGGEFVSRPKMVERLKEHFGVEE